MITTAIRRGTIVFNVADPRHDGIVVSLHLRDGKLFANVRWLKTGWLSYRVPVADLRHAPIEHAGSLITAGLRRRLEAKEDV